MVRTMLTGLTENLRYIGDAKKTADEMKRLNVDIAALQETCLDEVDTIKEKDYMILLAT